MIFVYVSIVKRIKCIYFKSLFFVTPLINVLVIVNVLIKCHLDFFTCDYMFIYILHNNQFVSLQLSIKNYTLNVKKVCSCAKEKEYKKSIHFHYPSSVTGAPTFYCSYVLSYKLPLFHSHFFFPVPFPLLCRLA